MAEETEKANSGAYTIHHLMIASESNNAEMCDKILQSQPELINQKYPYTQEWVDKSPFNPNATPIHYVARSGHDRLLCVLVDKYKADIQATDPENWNALTYACNAGHPLVAKELLKRGVKQDNVSTVEGSTPLQFAQYKKWNDIVPLFDEQASDKPHEYTLQEKQEIFAKTRQRLSKLIIAADGRKLCTFYQSEGCRNGDQCKYAHIDLNENNTNDSNKDIGLDLYLHRYRIDFSVYHKLKQNLCNADTPILAFQCIDTQLKVLDSTLDDRVWFLIFHDRQMMHSSRTAFESIEEVQVLRSSSISRFDHVLVFQIKDNATAPELLQKRFGANIDIVGLEKQMNVDDGMKEAKQDEDGDQEMKELKNDDNNDNDESKQNNDDNSMLPEKIRHILNNLNTKELTVGGTRGYGARNALVDYSLYDNISVEDRINLIQNCINNENEPELNRVIGCMYGMGIGDATGAPLEFLHCTADLKKSYFELKKKLWIQENNRFNLKRGQWTDDAAMGLCIADSLILHRKFDGRDIRIRFWNWWNAGYNNAFRYDKEYGQFKSSVGLGGNISNSLYSMRKDPTPAYISDTHKDDSGNGSIMRLAAIPAFYWNSDIETALQAAKDSSFTTHQGLIAAEACALMTYICISAIRRKRNTAADTDTNKKKKKKNDTAGDDIKIFLQEVSQQYLERIKVEYMKLAELQDAQKAQKKTKKGDKTLRRQIFAKECIIKLLTASEAKKSKERCWNWRSKSLGIEHTMKNRGMKYNGYPNSPGYFGSYCMDGLAMGLWACYHSKSFGTAIENAVNLLGDADSTGSIAGQIAGSWYGFKDVYYNTHDEGYLFKQITTWDRYGFGLRAVLLYHIGKTKGN